MKLYTLKDADLNDSNDTLVYVQTKAKPGTDIHEIESKISYRAGERISRPGIAA